MASRVQNKDVLTYKRLFPHGILYVKEIIYHVKTYDNTREHLYMDYLNNSVKKYNISFLKLERCCKSFVL